MVLYHRILSPASPEPNAIPLVVLHGLLGSSDNWQTLAGHWARTRPVVLIDQRNHGRSPHHPSHSYPDMVVDLLDTLDALGLDQVHLLGHSMGGKTAMYFADRHPQRCARLIIADMAPVAYPPHHTPLFDALAALDLTAHNRRTEIDKALALEVREPGIRQFLLKGLYRGEGNRFAWRYNLPVLRRHLADMTAFLPIGIVDLPTLAIYGANSDYVVGRGLKALKQHFSRLETLELKAGHWLHAEKPDAFKDAVLRFL